MNQLTPILPSTMDIVVSNHNYIRFCWQLTDVLDGGMNLKPLHIIVRTFVKHIDKMDAFILSIFNDYRHLSVIRWGGETFGNISGFAIEIRVTKYG